MNRTEPILKQAFRELRWRVCGGLGLVLAMSVAEYLSHYHPSPGSVDTPSIALVLGAPLVAMVFGIQMSGVLSRDPERTFLLSRPIEVWRVLVARYALGFLALAAIFVPPLLAQVCAMKATGSNTFWASYLAAIAECAEEGMLGWTALLLAIYSMAFFAMARIRKAAPAALTTMAAAMVLCLASAVAAGAYFVRARLGHIALTALTVLTLILIGTNAPEATRFHLAVLLMLAIPFIRRREVHAAERFSPVVPSPR